MTDASRREEAERRTEKAFAGSGWRDPRTAYRSLLKRLREQDPAGFEEAVADYERNVVTPVAAGTADPVRAWLEFGFDLANRLGPGGRIVRVDADGRATEDPSGALEVPGLLLHMPADEGAPALPVAMPREPSPAQQATLALLAEGRQALPG